MHDEENRGPLSRTEVLSSLGEPLGDEVHFRCKFKYVSPLDGGISAPLVFFHSLSQADDDCSNIPIRLVIGLYMVHLQ